MNAENYVNFYLLSQDFFWRILKILDEFEKVGIKLMRTIIEYTEFTKKAEKLFGSEEREAIVFHLSSNPKAGKT